MEHLYSISERLKLLRAHSGLTQEEFAEHAGMSYKFYQQIESGRKKLIRIDTIQRLAEAYGIELWEFFHPKLPKISLTVKKRINSSPHNRRREKKSPLLAK
ncbi:helix-turn-helix domain-containing protein [Candidatus Spyradosoma sp. SGI.093]|uniref:helix-turn-helix domain-containing protein n=1 Tax=Candidatus Spyradosoma sp. SGI.093 TaxID=3420583 RepID=UPI003D070B86